MQELTAIHGSILPMMQPPLYRPLVAGAPDFAYAKPIPKARDRASQCCTWHTVQWSVCSTLARCGFFPSPRLCHSVTGRTRADIRSHGARTRSAEAVLAPDISGPDDGVPGSVRADRDRALQADRLCIHGQSRP